MANGPEKSDEEPWQENLNMHLICKDCKEVPPKLVEEYSSGDMVCGDCGLVLGDRIVDTRSEWRTFSNDDQNNDDPSRVGDGPNLLLNGEQLQTSIAFGDGSKGARDLNRAQNKLVQDKGNKTLLAAYKEIGAMCDAINLTSVVTNHAKFLFKMVNDANAFRGKSQETVIAGCIFIACRHCSVPRTFREVFALTKVPKKEIGRIFKALETFYQKRNAKLAVSQANPIDAIVNTQTTPAKELCTRYCNKLGLTQKTTTFSENLAERMGKIGALAGRSPLSAAAACIYFASHLMGEPKTAKDIAQVVGVSDGTIRTAYKFLEGRKTELVSDETLKQKGGDLSLLPKP